MKPFPPGRSSTEMIGLWPVRNHSLVKPLLPRMDRHEGYREAISNTHWAQDSPVGSVRGRTESSSSFTWDFPRVLRCFVRSSRQEAQCSAMLRAGSALKASWPSYRRTMIWYQQSRRGLYNSKEFQEPPAVGTARTRKSARFRLDGVSACIAHYLRYTLRLTFYGFRARH